MRLKQVIVLAAGKGKRLGKTGQKRQKCSFLLQKNLPLLDKFFEEAIIIIGYQSSDVKEAVKEIKEKYSLNIKIKYLKQEELLGQGHAVYLTKDNIEDGCAFCVVNGDLLLKGGDFENFKKIFQDDIEMPLISVSRVDDPWNYGVAILHNNQIKGIIEKPKKGTEPSNLVISGIYFFDKKIFKNIEETKRNQKTNEIMLADTLDLIIKQNKKVNIFEIDKPKHLTTEKDLEEIFKI